MNEAENEVKMCQFGVDKPERIDGELCPPLLGSSLSDSFSPSTVST